MAIFCDILHMRYYWNVKMPVILILQALTLQGGGNIENIVQPYTSHNWGVIVNNAGWYKKSEDSMVLISNIITVLNIMVLWSLRNIIVAYT